MYHKIADYMADYIVAKQVGRQEYIEIYSYGFEKVLVTISEIILLFGIAAIVGRWEQVLIYFMFATLLRVKSGGMHKDTYISCFLTYIVVVFSAIGIVEIMCSNMPKLLLIVLPVEMITSVLLVYYLAPVDSAKKRLDDDEKITLRKKSIQCVVIEVVVICVLCIMGKSESASIAGVAVFIQSITLLPALNREKEI